MSVGPYGPGGVLSHFEGGGGGGGGVCIPQGVFQERSMTTMTVMITTMMTTMVTAMMTTTTAAMKIMIIMILRMRSLC